MSDPKTEGDFFPRVSCSNSAENLRIRFLTSIGLTTILRELKSLEKINTGMINSNNETVVRVANPLVFLSLY